MIDIGSTIGIASTILSAVPKIAELFSKARDAYNGLRAVSINEADVAPVLVRIISEEKGRLDELIDEYYRIDKDKTADSIEKKKAQKRIAEKICQLLNSIDPIKDKIDGYDVLKELYCVSIPNALA